jgi:hypothetical protein
VKKKVAPAKVNPPYHAHSTRRKLQRFPPGRPPRFPPSFVSSAPKLSSKLRRSAGDGVVGVQIHHPPHPPRRRRTPRPTSAPLPPPLPQRHPRAARRPGSRGLRRHHPHQPALRPRDRGLTSTSASGGCWGEREEGEQGPRLGEGPVGVRRAATASAPCRLCLSSVVGRD